MTAIVVAAIAVAYLMWLARRAMRRTVAGTCARCGGEPIGAVDGVWVGAGPQPMCAKCADTTARNHRAAFWFFVALAPIMVLTVTVGLLSDLRAGFGWSWTYVLFYLGAIGIPMFMAGMVRLLSRGVS